MLVLTRKADEQIMIGNDITVTVVRVHGNRVRIGIAAPRHVRVTRGELPRNEVERNEVETHVVGTVMVAHGAA
jgi:carbon storage regulator CsrA